MDPELLARGFILGFTIAAAVGPISLLCIKRTLAEGRTVGFVSGLGVATADATYGAIAAFGLTAITDQLVAWRQPLAIVGGLFLLWIAWRTIRSVPGEAATDPSAGGRDRRGLVGAYLSTLGLTMTNPMTILSFAALFVGLGVTADDVAGATLLTLGVFLGQRLVVGRAGDRRRGAPHPNHADLAAAREHRLGPHHRGVRPRGDLERLDGLACSPSSAGRHRGRPPTEVPNGQAVASSATFDGWRIRMALPNGSRMPMSVP